MGHIDALFSLTEGGYVLETATIDDVERAFASPSGSVEHTYFTETSSTHVAKPTEA